MLIEQVAKSVAGAYDLPQTEQNSAASGSFVDYLKEAIHKVDQLQKEAEISALNLALGEEPNLHNTVIAYEKAKLALQLTIEARNRIVEAYQEIMRMQF
ncbi:MAG TPA: flagellar hook-basal body complex protein FliE [Syntrophomonadaceae bacterium]|jgi:flagellar hook-basal body complex protein FliE|nr:flagellar hook-basal body complex protein FliE [Syntrophomonadaceae bacterium]